MEKTTNQLATHGEKDIFCEVCGKGFYHAHAMKLHYDSVHTDKLRVQCDLCNKVFRNRYSLHAHLKQFHAPNVTVYACEVCGKTFKQHGNMQKHRMGHDADRRFQCTYCPKKFKYPEQLRRHVLLHTQGKALQCDICDRRFVMRYELNKHKKDMHNNKVFICAFCNETCKWRHTMKRHIKRKHPRSASVTDDPSYLKSLLTDTNDAKTRTTSNTTSNTLEPHPNSNAQLTVIAMDSLNPEQIIELEDDQQIVGHVADEGATIHLYSQQESFLPQVAAEALQRLSAGQQQVTINEQQFTINFSNGQAVLTPVELEKDDSASAMTSLLRTQNTDISNINPAGGSQVVISRGNPVDSIDTLPDGAQVLLSNDGAAMVYTSEALQVVQGDTNTVNFTDIAQFSHASNEDPTKLMFFNILNNSQDTT